MAIPRSVAKMLVVEVTKALDCSRIQSTTMVHEDLELLNSSQSVESYTFVAA